MNDSYDVGSAFLSVIMFVVLLIIYLLPFLVASYRRHPNLVPIFLINIFLGWTLIGWVGALAWSFTNLKLDD
ncbi:hypothetical protein R84981_002757 [Carnimonas sp. R-84981]|uniref:superinfection immunity protein n=1 Tax=Carnimonas bestiolae TaxID=3402172 RepID=UPI003EDC3AC0